MTVLLSDNIISALGFSTTENYRKVKQGISGLQFFADRYGLPEPFMASEIDEVRLNEAFEKVSILNFTKLEKASIVSITEALKKTDVNPTSKRVLFVFSTTKGNIFLLDKSEHHEYESNRLYLWRSAELITRFFRNPNPPVVVSNACISGASAMITAQRALRSGRYDYVIVVGVDVLSKFVISGFQSFKALSQDVCKPFDADRMGLNIGEAVATVIMVERDENELSSGDVTLTVGAVRNDANHISGPSREGEGSYLALRSVLKGVDNEEIAFICAHGTATPYNDEMEAVAITRAGLENVPVNCLKGYIGHTLGAAGVVESILSIQALKDNTILKTYGFKTSGITYPLDIVTENRETNRLRCIKMLSGFGGCNVAVLFTKVGSDFYHKGHKGGTKNTKDNSVLCEKPLCSLWLNKDLLPSDIRLKSHSKIIPGRMYLNGNMYFDSGESHVGMNESCIHDFFATVYHHLRTDYRKFFKMDTLSKLGFLLSELLLADTDREKPKEDMGIVLFNRSSSLQSDGKFQRTIQDKDNFFPSPSDFVYTLPNIVAGEIAIRNKIRGETSFYILPDFQVDRIYEGIVDMIRYGEMKQALAGWTEVNPFSGEIYGEMALFEANKL